MTKCTNVAAAVGICTNAQHKWTEITAFFCIGKLQSKEQHVMKNVIEPCE